MILGINGSPRRGNSFTLLERFLSGAKINGKDVLLIDACKLNILPCQECGFCMKKKKCRLTDEMSDYIDILTKCSHIAVASPVFFFGISAQLKTFIDRCQPLWAKKYIFHEDLSKNFQFMRKGFFFSTGGFNKDITFRGGELAVQCFFDSLSVKFEDKIFATSMEEKGDIHNKPELLEKAFNLGKNL
jgi:multimeric flavodoxin WrbA